MQRSAFIRICCIFRNWKSLSSVCVWQSASVFVSSVAHNDESKLNGATLVFHFEPHNSFGPLYPITLHCIVNTPPTLFYFEIIYYCWSVYCLSMCPWKHSIRCVFPVVIRWFLLHSRQIIAVLCARRCHLIEILTKNSAKESWCPRFCVVVCGFSVFHSVIFVAFGCLCFCARRSQLNDNVAFEIALNWNCVVELRHFRKLSLISDGLLLSLFHLVVQSTLSTKNKTHKKSII